MHTSLNKTECKRKSDIIQACHFNAQTDLQGEGLQVVTLTPRCIIRTPQKKDAAASQARLWGNPRVMATFSECKIREYWPTKPNKSKKSKDYAEKLLNQWQKKFDINCPWSGYSVLNKQTGDLIGHIAINRKFQLKYLYHPSAWGKGVASEVALAFTHVTIPNLIQLGYTPTLSYLEATALEKNLASQKVLSKTGFTQLPEIRVSEQAGSKVIRFVYQISLQNMISGYYAFGNIPARARCHAVVHVPTQQLTCYRSGQVMATFSVSTARAGVGCVEGTQKTPAGEHCVFSKHGAGAVSGTILVKFRRSNQICKTMNTPLERDLILTRALRLNGCEQSYNQGVNRQGQCIDSLQRGIAIHGTNREDLVEQRKPASAGCVRMKNQDIIKLFDMLEPGDRVYINDGQVQSGRLKP